MLIGYARVSTRDQDTAVQIATLEKAECELIFQEKVCGGRWDRPELHRLLGQLRNGDVVVVWKLDRLSRSLKDLLTLMEKIDQAELDVLEKKAEQFEVEMKSLCASGKRDAAQEKAMVYMKEIVNSSAVREAKKCGEKMKGMMQGMMSDAPFMNQDKDYSSQHVCDSYKE